MSRAEHPKPNESSQAQPPGIADTLPAEAPATVTIPIKYHINPSQLSTMDAPPGYPFTPLTPAPQSPTTPSSDPLRLHISDSLRYRIEGEYAQGGIGRILLARDERLNRRVALKELLRSRGQGEERFIREALLTARLEHPSIVPVYDAGRRPTGELFFAMKLVSGRSLEDIIAPTTDWKARLALLPHLLAAAEAIAYAHSRKVIHRDLKPSNILIGEFGETMVIDWGLGKDISNTSKDAPQESGEAPEIPAQENLIELPTITMEGAIMGTPAYMAPEQALGKSVDQRADVYALGALLYQLLSGHPPFTGDDARRVLKAVQSEEPIPLQTLQKSLPDDLVAIVLKAMSKDPEGRYASAREFADDLRRFQTGQIVGAHAYSKTELVLRFARRYKFPLATIAAALILLSGAGIFGFKNIVEQRDRAERKEATALRRSDELVLLQARTALESDPNKSIEWLRHLSPLFTQWNMARLIAADAESRGLSRQTFQHKGAVAGIAFSPGGEFLASAEHDRHVKWISLQNGTERVLEGHADEVWNVAFSADGKWLASSGKDGLIRLWDARADASFARELPGHKAGVRSLVFSPAPHENLLASLSWDDRLILWDCNTFESHIISNKMQSLTNAAFSPNGELIAAGSEDNTVKVWNTKGELIHTLSGHEDAPLRVVFAGDPNLLASAGRDTTVRLWNLKDKKSIVCQGHSDEVSALAFSPDARTLASAGKDAVIRLWDSSSGALLRTLSGHKSAIRALSFSPDGSYLLSASEDRSAAVWNIKRGEGRFLYGFSDSVTSTLFSPDGRTIAAAGADSAIHFFQADTPHGQILSGRDAQLSAFTAAAEDTRVAAGHADGMVYIYHQMPEPLSFFAHEGSVTELAFSPDGELFASAGRDGAVRVWDSVGHNVWTFNFIELGAPSSNAQLSFSPDGRYLVYLAKDGLLFVFDVIAGARRTPIAGLDAATRILFLPNGNELVVGEKSGALLVWNLDAQTLRTLRETGDPVKLLALSPDGKTLAAANTAPSLRFIDIASGWSQNPGLLGGVIGKLVFSPDGGTVYLFCWPESIIRRISLRTGGEIPALRGHVSGITGLSISFDGTRLISTSYDKTLLLWDLESGQNRVLRGHTEAVLQAHFLAGGEWITSMGADNTIRLWPDDLPWDERALRAQFDAMQGSSYRTERNPSPVKPF